MTFADVDRTIWDAVVVGAGPAGALCAYQLARLGRSVLLLERSKFPRSKVCGSCLGGVARRALEKAGLADLPERCGAVPLESAVLSIGGVSATIRLGRWLALSRERFDAALVDQAIQAGVVFLQETHADLGRVGANYRVVSVRNRTGTEEVRGRVIIGADGLGGRLLARAGAPGPHMLPNARIGAGQIISDGDPFFAPGRVYMACGREGYLGLVRLEDGRLDLAAALDPQALKAHGGVGPTVAALLTSNRWPVPKTILSTGWTGTPVLTRRSPVLGAERVLIVGDAAGYVEPFTGEGIGWALAGALRLAPLAAQPWAPRHLQRWQCGYRQTVLRRQTVIGWAARVLRDPFLTRLTIRVLGACPWLATPVLRLIS